MINIFYTIVFLALSFVFCKNALHMFQQNHYELKRYSKWLFSKSNIHFPYILVYILLMWAILFIIKGFVYDLIVLFLSIVFAIVYLYLETKKKYIKDLDITNRVKRQILFMFVLMFICIYLLCIYLPKGLAGSFAVILPYIMIYPMAILTMPLEHYVKKYYENDARRIIEDMPQLIKVGITGSFGKTSTKNIVTNIIGENYFTLMTPASFNTPMGITRTIREHLKPIHEVFVCEMGADKVGDISYLMDFVKPKYGIVTSIGPQHLATFKSIDNIIKEKMKEIEMLPEDGVGIVNVDIPYICDYEIKNTCKVVTIGIKNQNADYFAKNIKYSKDGTSFTVKINDKNYKFETCLLGEHNVTNLLTAIALAVELNIPMKDIVENVKHVKQVEHRLELKEINGYTFIDDAFNSNPVGSKMATDVLSMMPGKRVMVTPGLIDLGKAQTRYNRELGEYMAERIDCAILVGEKQTKPIYDGLTSKGFKKEDIIVVDTVKQAFDYVYKNFTRKDTILLENDLPDAFSK